MSDKETSSSSSTVKNIAVAGLVCGVVYVGYRIYSALGGLVPNLGAFVDVLRGAASAIVSAPEAAADVIVTNPLSRALFGSRTIPLDATIGMYATGTTYNVTSGGLASAKRLPGATCNVLGDMAAFTARANPDIAGGPELADAFMLAVFDDPNDKVPAITGAALINRWGDQVRAYYNTHPNVKGPDAAAVYLATRGGAHDGIPKERHHPSRVCYGYLLEWVLNRAFPDKSPFSVKQ